MGRVKINTTKYIDEAKTRHTTFNKRRNGLVKKASELSMLCGIKMLLIFEDTNGTIVQYSTDAVYDQYEYFGDNLKTKAMKLSKHNYPEFFSINHYKKGKADYADDDSSKMSQSIIGEKLEEADLSPTYNQMKELSKRPNQFLASTSQFVHKQADINNNYGHIKHFRMEKLQRKSPNLKNLRLNLMPQSQMDQTLESPMQSAEKNFLLSQQKLMTQADYHTGIPSNLSQTGGFFTNEIGGFNISDGNIMGEKPFAPQQSSHHHTQVLSTFAQQLTQVTPQISYPMNHQNQIFFSNPVPEDFFGNNFSTPTQGYANGGLQSEEAKGKQYFSFSNPEGIFSKQVKTKCNEFEQTVEKFISINEPQRVESW